MIVLPEMVTGRPSALMFSVLPLPLASPSTEIGVVAEGVMLNVSLPVALGSTPIEADGAMSVPATVTVAPLGSSLRLAVIVIGENASIVEPDSNDHVVSGNERNGRAGGLDGHAGVHGQVINLRLRIIRRRRQIDGIAVRHIRANLQRALGGDVHRPVAGRGRVERLGRGSEDDARDGVCLIGFPQGLDLDGDRLVIGVGLLRSGVGLLRDVVRGRQSRLRILSACNWASAPACSGLIRGQSNCRRCPTWRQRRSNLAW